MERTKDRVPFPHLGPTVGAPAAEMLLESLRYAGHVVIHRDDEQGMCFDIRPPHGLESGQWAKMNAQRMQSFGFNAVKAPSTDPVSLEGPLPKSPRLPTGFMGGQLP
jgi:hypothetical protein